MSKPLKPGDASPLAGEMAPVVSLVSTVLGAGLILGAMRPGLQFAPTAPSLATAPPTPTPPRAGG